MSDLPPSAPCADANKADVELCARRLQAPRFLAVDWRRKRGNRWQNGVGSHVLQFASALSLAVSSRSLQLRECTRRRAVDNALQSAPFRFLYRQTNRSFLFRAQVAASIGQSSFDFRSAKRKLAERGGFEPPVRLPVHMISNHAHSTTLSPLHGADDLRPKAVAIRRRGTPKGSASRGSTRNCAPFARFRSALLSLPY